MRWSLCFSRLRLSSFIFALFLPLMALLPIHAPLQSADEAKPAAKFELHRGDHICIIGNTLADRMQHDGWLETMLHSRFPKHELVIRNLGFSADELTLRLRSANFGSPDQWLAGDQPIPEPSRLITRKGLTDNRLERTNTRADVIFAFFGYNESFAGEDGTRQVQERPRSVHQAHAVAEVQRQSAPRLVLFSPIAHEDLQDRNLPTARRTTSGSNCTPKRWPKSPR